MYPSTSIISVICDISSNKMVQAAAANIHSQLGGPVDVLINNAGIVHGKTFFQLTESQIRQTFEVNALGHFWMNKAFMPLMMKRNQGHGYGHIVTISSTM